MIISLLKLTLTYGKNNHVIEKRTWLKVHKGVEDPAIDGDLQRSINVVMIKKEAVEHETRKARKYCFVEDYTG